LSLDDTIIALRESETLDSLKKVFGPAYKIASDDEKAELKKHYDKRK
jgi:hypothetical protein